MDGLARRLRFLTALPERVTCQKEATTYGTVRPFLDCILVLGEKPYPAGLEVQDSSLAGSPWVAVAHE
jgi:hypothetical protein